MMSMQPHPSGEYQGHTMIFGAISAGKSPLFLLLVAAEQKRRAARLIAGSRQPPKPKKQEPRDDKQAP